MNMECDICGYQWDDDDIDIDQCPACGSTWVGPIDPDDEEASDEK